MNLNSLTKIEPKRKITIITVCFLLSISFITYAVITPTIDKIRLLRSQIITQKVELEKKLNRETNMSKLAEKLKKIEPQLEKFERIFINQNRELEFITSLEKIAGKNNVSQKINLAPKKSNIDGIYKNVPITLAVSGNFVNLRNYLVDLETMSYYLNISQLTITNTPSTGTSKLKVPGDNGAITKKINASLNITGNTYWK